MKAVILELRGAYAAALTGDGCVRKVKNKNYAVGQTVELKTVRKPDSKLVIRIASAAAILALVGIPTYAYYTPYSYVSLDVNSSIEYSLNRFDRVLSYTAVGENAALFDHLNLKNKPIKKAIELTLDAITEKGDLTRAEPGDIIITASSRDAQKSDQLAETLEDTAKAAADKSIPETQVASESVGQEQVREAKDLGTTPGKLNLIRKLQESAADEKEVVVEEWLDKPVKEIIKQTNENEKSNNNGSAAGQDHQKSGSGTQKNNTKDNTANGASKANK